MTLQHDESTTQLLPADKTLSVVTPANSTGQVTRLGRLPGQEPQSVTAITASTTTVFGPYPNPERFLIRCFSGTLTATDAPLDVDSFVNSEINNAVLSANPLVLNLPTSDPLFLNALWSDSGTVKVSAGPPP